jgi:hypothetical protein
MPLIQRQLHFRSHKSYLRSKAEDISTQPSLMQPLTSCHDSNISSSLPDVKILPKFSQRRSVQKFFVDNRPRQLKLCPGPLAVANT